MEMESYFSSSERICFKVLVLFLVAARACMYTLLQHGLFFKDINTQLSYCNKFQRIHNYVLFMCKIVFNQNSV